jgi:hypothetical protein
MKRINYKYYQDVAFSKIYREAKNPDTCEYFSKNNAKWKDSCLNYIQSPSDLNQWRKLTVREAHKLIREIKEESWKEGWIKYLK